LAVTERLTIAQKLRKVNWISQIWDTLAQNCGALVPTQPACTGKHNMISNIPHNASPLEFQPDTRIVVLPVHGAAWGRIFNEIDLPASR
jgi:hypothetical protein